MTVTKAMVTGASSGIGKATAVALARAGFSGRVGHAGQRVLDSGADLRPRDGLMAVRPGSPPSRAPLVRETALRQSGRSPRELRR